MQQLSINNLKSYNLFNSNTNSLILRALLVSETEINILLKKPLDQNSTIHLFNSLNKQIDNISITLTPTRNTIKIKGQFNTNQNYIVKVNNHEENVIIDPKVGGFLDQSFFSNDTDFGLSQSKKSFKFKLWSPPAVRAELLLFDHNQEKIQSHKQYWFKNRKLGIWELKLSKKKLGLKSLKPIYYQFKIHAYGKEYIALDPYAISMAIFDPNSDDKIGKAAIIDLKKVRPKGFKRNYRNSEFIDNKNDVIVYELNIRDFTIQPGVLNKTIAGTFKGLIEKIPYLKELGITHVQLMPVNKAYTQNELNKEFTDKSAKESNYNWGYDPMNYFTLEGRYSTNPKDPYSRIIEFKEMIQALHNAGIGVILDVVFNHTYLANTFEHIAPGCYYRYTKDLTISNHTGAGASLESQHKQVRKFIIDVLKFFILEYHIDGFRFDLMSFHDKETMNQIRNLVGKVYNPKDVNDLILLGEAWCFTDIEKNAFIKTSFDPLNIGIFNDTFRDSIAGNIHDPGFIQGNSDKVSELSTAIIGGIKSFDQENFNINKNDFYNPYNLFSEEPGDCLNFLSIHDGLTIWDKINLLIKDKNKSVKLEYIKFAYAILFTSQGKLIIHGGDEILRTKPLAEFDKERHRAITSNNTDTELGTKFFQENSYASNDYTNMFRWDRLTNDYSEFANELLAYVKDLIKMRRLLSFFRFESKKDINKHVRFINNEKNNKVFMRSFLSHKLEKLTVKFKNGPPGKKYYIAGEVHNKDANPLTNTFSISFDNKGFAEITFKNSEIKSFNLNNWDKSGNLNLKIVKTPGEWDFLDYAYSDYGHNSIGPEFINNNFETEIDLSVKDFKNIRQESQYKPKKFIAYVINNFENKQLSKIKFKKILVVHNSDNISLEINFDEINEQKNWLIILDNKRFNKNGIINSSVSIGYKRITVPRTSSCVLAKI